MEQLAWLSVDSALPAERRPPTAGRKPVSFGLAAPNGGRLNSNGAFSIHDVGARREIPVADRRPMELCLRTLRPTRDGANGTPPALKLMSQLGHFRKLGVVTEMSGLPIEADIVRGQRQVRKVPKAEVTRLQPSLNSALVPAAPTISAPCNEPSASGICRAPGRTKRSPRC